MGKIYFTNGWLIRVQGNEHPPVHVHVLHPNGKALITFLTDLWGIPHGQLKSMSLLNFQKEKLCPDSIYQKLAEKQQLHFELKAA
jgi:hypothetical protein